MSVTSSRETQYQTHTCSQNVHAHKIEGNKYKQEREKLKVETGAEGIEAPDLFVIVLGFLCHTELGRPASNT